MLAMLNISLLLFAHEMYIIDEANKTAIDVYL